MGRFNKLFSHSRFLSKMALGLALAGGPVLTFVGTGAFSVAQAQEQAQANALPSDWVLGRHSGAWLICAASYVGPDAPEMARQCCETLRERDKLPAYVLNRGDDERRRIKEEYEQMRNTGEEPQGRRRTVRVTEQCAVLVGGFATMEAARAKLDKIKKLDPPKIQVNGNKLAADVETLLVPSKKGGAEILRREVNPFQNSFTTRNPTIPVEKKEKPDAYPFLVKLNSDESYSLLKNKGNWTLAVKEYRGATLVQPLNPNAGGSILEKLGFGPNKPGEALNASAMQAHESARVLRRLEFDAYVLHDKTCSYVTVGSFQSKDDPRLAQLAGQLASLSGSDLKPLALFPQPQVMEIPKPKK